MLKLRLMLWVAALGLMLGGAEAGRDSAGAFYTLNSSRYKLTTDVRRDTAREIARHMDAVNAEYARLFARLPDRRTRDYPLYVFSQHADYMTFLDKQGVDATGSGGMFFDRWNASGLTTYIGQRSHDRVLQTLRHEGFHQFARSKFGTGLPAWANEGLAEYFGEAIVVGDRLMVGQVPATRLARVQTAIHAESYLPFQELMTMSKGEWNRRLRRGDGKMQYQQAWMIVHFFFHDASPYRKRFERYLALIAEGYESADAFGEAFKTTNYQSFEEPWKRYVLSLRPNPEKAAAQRLEFLAAGLKYLYTRDKAVTSLEDLKEQLRAIGAGGYWLRFNIGHDQAYEMRASDEENFQAPETGDGAEASLEFVASPEPSIPPTLWVRGLSCDIGLEWLRDADNLVSRIVYQPAASTLMTTRN